VVQQKLRSLVSRDSAKAEYGLASDRGSLYSDIATSFSFEFSCFLSANGFEKWKSFKV
jgi:hypothetical protein